MIGGLGKIGPLRMELTYILRSASRLTTGRPLHDVHRSLKPAAPVGGAIGQQLPPMLRLPLRRPGFYAWTRLFHAYRNLSSQGQACGITWSTTYLARSVPPPRHFEQTMHLNGAKGTLHTSCLVNTSHYRTLYPLPCLGSLCV
jgi:hypothetical protein